MSSIEKDIELYIKEINKKLICNKKNRQQIISDIENSIYDFAENKGVSDIKEIHKRFGTPDEVANQYLSQEYKKTVNNTTDKKRIIIIVIVCIILFSIIFSLMLYHNNPLNEKRKYYYKEPISVESMSEYLSEHQSIMDEKYGLIKE